MKREVTVKKLKEFLNALEKEKIFYMIIAGFGLDGKRGFQTRPHQDVDILCLKKNLKKLERIIANLKYRVERHNDLLKLYRKDGSKIDLALITIEKKEAVTYGRIAITRFPSNLLDNTQKGHIDRFYFTIAPNELLKTWGKDSKKGNDAEYSNSLDAKDAICKKIRRVLE